MSDNTPSLASLPPWHLTIAALLAIAVGAACTLAILDASSVTRWRIALNACPEQSHGA